MSAASIWKTQARLGSHNGPRIVQFGDSFGDYGTPRFRLWGEYGYGYCFDFDAQHLTFAGGASAHYDSYIYPGMGMTSVPAGGSVIYYGGNSGGPIQPPSGSILDILYVAEAGAGTFKIQVDRARNGVFTDVVTVNADNGGAATPTWIHHDMGASHYYRIKIIGLTGTSRVIFALPTEKDTTGTGGNRAQNATYLRFDQGGTKPDHWLRSAANWPAILGGYDPHIIIISALETLPDWQTYLPDVIANFRLAAPNADIVIVSQPPSTNDNDAGDIEVNNWLRDFCEGNQVCFIDTFSHFPKRNAAAPPGFYEPQTHLGPVGVAVSHSVVWEWLRSRLPQRGTFSPNQYSPPMTAQQRAGVLWLLSSNPAHDTQVIFANGTGNQVNYYVAGRIGFVSETNPNYPAAFKVEPKGILSTFLGDDGHLVRIANGRVAYQADMNALAARVTALETP